MSVTVAEAVRLSDDDADSVKLPEEDGKAEAVVADLEATTDTLAVALRLMVLDVLLHLEPDTLPDMMGVALAVTQAEMLAVVLTLTTADTRALAVRTEGSAELVGVALGHADGSVDGVCVRASVEVLLAVANGPEGLALEESDMTLDATLDAEPLTAATGDPEGETDRDLDPEGVRLLVMDREADAVAEGEGEGDCNEVPDTNADARGDGDAPLDGVESTDARGDGDAPLDGVAAVHTRRRKRAPSVTTRLKPNPEDVSAAMATGAPNVAPDVPSAATGAPLTTPESVLVAPAPDHKTRRTMRLTESTRNTEPTASAAMPSGVLNDDAAPVPALRAPNAELPASVLTAPVEITMTRTRLPPIGFPSATNKCVPGALTTMPCGATKYAPTPMPSRNAQRPASPARVDTA